MTGATYRARIASEQAIYRDCVDVHNLPPIFHYWSDKHIRPRLESFGFSNPDGAFKKYFARQCRRVKSRTPRFVSIGAGNCDLEIDLALHLSGLGYTDFSIECLELNPAMLRRGEADAERAGVSDSMVFTQCDCNEWQPGHLYDGAMANQSLHHVVQLEALFARIHEALAPDGCFVISDMIGRNGHQRWPEALELVQSFWRGLPPSYRFNPRLARYEELYKDWDCSLESFEGIRAQDILPLLLDRFHFEVFVAFGNVIDPFVDRSFGWNFDPKAAWDREFIDGVHAADEAALRSGRVTPTHMVAVVGKDKSVPPAFSGNLSAVFCVRDSQTRRFPSFETQPRPLYDWGAWPHSAQRELETACEHLRRSEIRIEELSRWAAKLEAESRQRTEWAFSLQHDCDERTNWARRLETELAVAGKHVRRLEAESAERAVWALGLEAELQERTAWALRMESDLNAMDARREELEAELTERTAWALQLNRELEETRARVPTGVRKVFRKLAQRLGRG
jgi:SAM-dependent methyltransferase